jgi:hypothetical protein
MTTTLKTLSAFAIAAAALSVTLATSNGASANPFRHPGHGPVVQSKPFKVSPILQKIYGNGGRIITCLACNLPRPKPIHPHPLPWRNHHWNYGGYHGYGWHYRPAVVVAGAPEAVIPAPVQAAPVAATPVSAAPCSCLTKQSLPDGGVLFQDICTKESAIATPAEAAAR